MVTTGSFSFDGYEVHKDRQTLYFRYNLSEKTGETGFEEKILLPEPIPEGVSSQLLENIMQSLLLVLGLSYWKTTCAPSIYVKPFTLTPRQADFWNTLYTKGMGEFFYRNSIDYRNLVNFPSGHKALSSPVTIVTPEKVLVGIGGGKDSIVTAKTLEAHSVPYTAVVFENERPYPVIDRVVSRLGAPVLRMRRIIDPRLFELNRKGYYNGHIPISSVYAFLGIAASVFYGYRYMIVSNEKSANSGNVSYLGTEINHQWSKSGEFERLFQIYVKENITPDVTYFSFLRPLSELQIMREFVKYEEFLPFFASCNGNFTVRPRGTENNIWCGTCPKCAFAFALLAAYVPKHTVVSVFGKDLFDDTSLLPTFRQLLGIADFKPFECVGTFEEVRASFMLISQKHEFDGSAVMKMFLSEVFPGLTAASKREVGESGNASLIPGKFLPLVNKLL